MTVRTKSEKSQPVRERAQELLTWARKRAAAGTGSAELFIVIFGAHGKANAMFPRKAERAAFERTQEYVEIRKLIETVTHPDGDQAGSSNGNLAVTLRLPKSVHAALIEEAAAEGVSLDKLCLSKLVAQLRELV